MKKLIILILICLCTNCFVAAQNTMLWKIEKEGAVSYLFGTNHSMTKRLTDSFPIVKELISSANKFITEADVTDTNTVKSFYAGLPDNPKITRLLNKHDQEFIRSFAKDIDPLKYSLFELNGFLATQLLGNSNTKNKNSGSNIEADLADFARKNNPGIEYLETPLDQVKLVHNFKPSLLALPFMKKGIRLFIAQLKDSAKTNPIVTPDKREKLYKGEVVYDFNKPCAGKYQKTFLVKRNNAWLKKLDSDLKTGNAFISVGLDHLRYKCGLISQLKNRGYNVSPVNMRTGEIMVDN